MSVVSKVAEPYAEALLDLAKSSNASAYGSATLFKTIDISY